MVSRRNIVIAGAGVAGLTAALTLVKAGYRVQIIEKSSKIDDAGVGIQLSPNATCILDELGLSRRLTASSFVPENVVIANGRTGRILSKLPLGETVRRRHGHPYLVLHRADLANILLGACHKHPDIAVDFDTSFQDAAMHANGVTVLAHKDGSMTEYSGCALVGADGVGSAVRANVIGANAASPAGDVAWRALVPVDRLPSGADLHNTRLWIGANGHVVTYPVRNSRVLNIVAITPRNVTADLTRRNYDVDSKTITDFYRNWSMDLKLLLNSAESWSGWPLREIDPNGVWARQSAVLIGDAAHAMLPYLAQGGGAAIEDAAVLAKFLSPDSQDIDQALANFAEHRKIRAALIWSSARSQRSIYHMRHVSAFSRNVFLRTANLKPFRNFTNERLHRRMDWLYGWKA